MNEFNEIKGDGYLIRAFGNHAEGTFEVSKEKSLLDGTPCLKICQTAMRFSSDISLSKNKERPVDAKSILAISLVFNYGKAEDKKITFVADGRDAKEAIIELIRISQILFDKWGYGF